MQRLRMISGLAAVLLLAATFGTFAAGAPRAHAQEAPDLAEALAEALNADQADAATALFAENARFTDLDGGSFGAFGHQAIGFIFNDSATDSDFHLEIQSNSGSSGSATGVVAVTDADAVAAGVDRYLQPFTLTAVDGKIAAFDLTYDESDAQTQTYLAYSNSQSGDDGAPGDSIDLTLAGSQSGSAGVFDASAFAPGGVSGIFVGLDTNSDGKTANIYEGTCDALGDVTSALAKLVGDGSFNLVSVSYEHLTSEPHAIAVLSDDGSTVVSCGDIAAGASGPGLPNTGSGPSGHDMPLASLAMGLLALAGVIVVGTGAAKASRRN